MRKRLRVTINVPQDAVGSAYSRLAFIPQDTEVSTQSMEDAYTTDIFIALAPNIDESLEVTSFEVASAGRFKPVECTFSIKNIGNTYVDIDATAQLSSTAGPAVRELRLEGRDTRILPGVTRVFTITDEQGLESGTYNVELTIRVDGRRAAYEARIFSI